MAPQIVINDSAKMAPQIVIDDSNTLTYETYNFFCISADQNITDLYVLIAIKPAGAPTFLKSIPCMHAISVSGIER